MFESILNNVARFIDLTPVEKDQFTSLIQIKKLRKHQYLVQEGDVCRFEAFINKGSMRSFSVDDKGYEHVVLFGIEDWWIGDLYSFFTQTPSRYNVEALEDSELFCLDKPSLEKLYSGIPRFERFFRILIQNAFVAQQQRIIANMSQSAEERYTDFINRYPQFEKRFPQYHIASYLGIKPESLSRIRGQRTKNKPAS
ncbi:Crp/Fnr family transcriptional regulator [Terrimonas pollutisoli]|uniref:Crp/Fnr family transcriptional regulator n=1 Tax=Terrimonas pollutisoli TaxID=3034147 RepID=UPI0023ECAE71|nr:Crp/Fnr family transcriptional regulator [Terrimonas sp. H1YJ31]